MNAVKDIQSLIQLIHSREEVIVFPIGGEGQQLVNFLRYANLLHRISCIAASEVPGNNTAQTFKHEVPVIPFEHLVHFRETAIFIVAGNEQYYPQINEGLTLYGCKTIFFVSDELHAQINESLQSMASSGQIMMWFMNHFDRKITELEYRIEEQNEVTAVNTKAFAEYKNAFRDRDVVIVACGPTVNYYKPLHDAIHIGVNFSWKKEDIPFDYHFIIDLPNNSKIKKQIKEDFSKIEEKVKEKIFIRNHRLRPDEYAPSEEFSFIGKKVVRFFSGEYSGGMIYQNICYHLVREHWTVVFNALHFALFTCPKRIFLVGCDTAISGHFYYDKASEINGNTFWLAKLKTNYAMMKMFAKDYYPETEIISINPVGLRGLFKDVYTDEYLKALEEEKKSSEQLKEG